MGRSYRPQFLQGALPVMFLVLLCFLFAGVLLFVFSALSPRAGTSPLFNDIVTGSNERTKKVLSYDYIVVGSGPAGITIATMLSADGDKTVLLLEAGGNHDSDPPITSGANVATTLLTYFFPQYFYQQQMVPNFMTPMPAQYTNGRLLGGGSSINGMQYVWPSPNVLHKWYEASGNDPDWSPSSIHAAFKAIESLNGPTSAPNIRGFNGPLDLRSEPAPGASGSISKFMQALNIAANTTTIIDYNDPSTPLGTFIEWQLTQQPNGRRESASIAMLTPDVLSRPNLVLQTDATVLLSMPPPHPRRPLVRALR